MPGWGASVEALTRRLSRQGVKDNPFHQNTQPEGMGGALRYCGAGVEWGGTEGAGGTDCGPVSIGVGGAGADLLKLGQMLSSRRDLPDVSFYHEMRKLQANAASIEGKLGRQVLAEELDEHPAKTFKRFEAEPIASVSIGLRWTCRISREGAPFSRT